MENSTPVQTRNLSFTIFIRDLPESSKEEELLEFFSEFGQILKVKLKMIKGNKVCGGYGFMECQERATFDAILAQNSFKYQGSHITCIENVKGVTLNLYKSELELRKIYVLGVPQSLKDEQLVDIFATAGEVSRAYTVKQGRKKQSKHFAFVIFKNVQGAKRALEIRKFRFQKFKLTCKKFESKKKKRPEVKPVAVKSPESKPLVAKKIEGKIVHGFSINRPSDPKIGPFHNNKKPSITNLKKTQNPSNFNLNFLKDFTDLGQEQAIHTPPARRDSLSNESAASKDQEQLGRNQEGRPGSAYTKCCINYKRPPSPQESIQAENQSVEDSPVLQSPVQDLARILIDEEFVKRELKVSEVLQDRASWVVRFKNHRPGNLKFAPMGVKPKRSSRSYMWF